MGYVIVGLIWCAFLEYYSTINMPGKDWMWRERIFHTFLWPVSLTIFLIALFRGS